MLNNCSHLEYFYSMNNSNQREMMITIILLHLYIIQYYLCYFSSNDGFAKGTSRKAVYSQPDGEDELTNNNIEFIDSRVRNGEVQNLVRYKDKSNPKEFWIPVQNQ